MTSHIPSRRDFGLLGLGAGFAAMASPNLAAAVTRPERPGVLLGVEAPRKPTDDDLKFLRQAGYDTAYVAADRLMSVEDLLALKARYAEGGVPLHHVRWFSGAPSGGSRHVANILLGLPEAGQSMEQCKQWLRNYGKAGFAYTIATLSITGVWSSRGMWRPAGDPAQTGSTRFTGTREFDANDPGVKAGGVFPNPGPGLNHLLYGREYGEDELLANYKGFLKQIVPIAEEEGVVINFHPDDPPTFKSLGGVARINGTFAQIKRNIDLADSPNVGPVLCLGVWLEGGDKMGMSAVDAIHHFVKTGKVREVNFRNVSAPLPKFAESYLDNGYADMYPLMKALVDSGFNGLVHQDHVLGMVGAPHSYGAYSAGYMRALLQRARREAGLPA